MDRSVLHCADPGAARPSAFPNSEAAEPSRAISNSRPSNWDRKEPRAILYDPSEHALSTLSMTTLKQTSDKFEVRLPPWKNRVDIYVDEKAKEGFVATVHLDRLGSAKNWQRRLRHNYTSLYVKGVKPGEISRTSSVSMGA